jgi:NAD(P)-dependent dehydrogenase (short-subunit alcohol dehydrogenase family)
MKKIILITGISTGFGRETARLLAENGHTVYGTVRKETDRISSVNYLIMDLADLNSVSKAVREVAEREGRIDILINNAGMHTGGPIETIPFEYARMQMDTNFLGMVYMTREVLPLMRKQGRGTIINFSSIGGLMGLPFQGFYSASKFAIEGFSEALRMEVNQFNINVVLINPGDFHTNNSANRRNYLARLGEGDPYGDQFSRSLTVIETDEGNGWEPIVLARKLVRIVECKKPHQRYIIASFEQKLAVALKNILPGKIFRMILQDHYKVK